MARTVFNKQRITQRNGCCFLHFSLATEALERERASEKKGKRFAMENSYLMFPQVVAYIQKYAKEKAAIESEEERDSTQHDSRQQTAHFVAC